ncbi:putative membrane protein [Candidatus Protochlamydia naegleriophila]|uniref:Putative membrane protein n=1 Tax=Candidatus Protochlamydia naegleriophila TaxID=389348 RepID=A0A0U5J9B6_9BACT|nr:hypothetical protein [Candidatus Protochlamydia naegleriophila]CUI16392.1 putative membrane protein [Candidatus Protochlamydia naegleriophila]
MGVKASQSRIDGIPSIEDDFTSCAPKGIGSVQGQAIHQLFSKDVFIQDLSQASLEETTSPSFWSKINPWWIPEIQANKIETSKTVSDMEIQKAEPISSVPGLDKPTLPGEASLEGVVPQFAPQSIKKQEVKLSEKDLLEVVSNLEQRTVDEVMAIVIKAQLEIERDGAALSQDSFTRLQNMRKIQEQMLEDVKEALAKDQRLAGYLDKAQMVAIAGAALCGLASIAITAGMSTPAVIAAAKFSGFFTAAITAITAGGKGYNNVRTNEDKASQTTYKHELQKTNESADDHRDEMVKFAESNGHFQDELIRLLKRLKKMNDTVFQG